MNGQKRKINSLPKLINIWEKQAAYYEVCIQTRHFLQEDKAVYRRLKTLSENVVRDLEKVIKAQNERLK